MNKKEYVSWFESHKGKSFGYLTVVALTHIGRSKGISLLCICGNTVIRKIHRIVKYGEDRRCGSECYMTTARIWPYSTLSINLKMVRLLLKVSCLIY